MPRPPALAAPALAALIALTCLASPARADDTASMGETPKPPAQPVTMGDAPKPPPESPAVSWATTQAVERTRLGRDHAARGEQDAALRAFLDAVAFDATYGPAYLLLGEVYEARGDVGEAERAFSMGIDHVVGFAEAFLARGKLRAHLHRGADAIADFEAAASLRPEAPGVLRELTFAYIAARALPAALAAARRRVALAVAQGDKRAAGEARMEALALARLVGEIDPVTAGASGRGAVRRALSAAEKTAAAPTRR